MTNFRRCVAPFDCPCGRISWGSLEAEREALISDDKSVISLNYNIGDSANDDS